MSYNSYRERGMERVMQRKRKIKHNVAMVIAALVVICICVLGVIGIKNTFFSKNKQDGNIGNVDNAAVVDERKDEGRIEKDVYIENVAVGGMDYDEAKKSIAAFVSEMSDKVINIDIDGNILSTNLKELGLSCESEKAIDDAFLMEDAGKVTMTFSIDEDVVCDYLKENSKDFTKTARNASLKRENGQFTIIKARKGKSVDVEATCSNISAVINSGIAGQAQINVSAVIVTEEPEYKTADVKKCTDVLGKYSTQYNASQTDRTANVKNAAAFIDGNVMYPGDELSVADTIYPLTEDNGYKLAPSYVSGQVVDSLGGGVCQVSTTLYNAVLLAELQVVERFPHSMVVNYVKPSMDAAIAGDYKDLKFKNNTKAPIYIQAYVDGGIITFTIYGDETRSPSRTIKYESEIVQEIKPGADVVTKDNTKPESYTSVTQQAHVGYIANLYKIVYENGAEVSRDKVNYSRYNAEPRHIIVGTKKDDKKDKKSDKDDESKSDKKKDSKTDKTDKNNSTKTDKNNNKSSDKTDNSSSSVESSDSSSNADNQNNKAQDSSQTSGDNSESKQETPVTDNTQSEAADKPAE